MNNSPISGNVPELAREAGIVGAANAEVHAVQKSTSHLRAVGDREGRLH